MALSTKLARQAQDLNSIALDVARETLSHMGTQLPVSGLFTVNCPPFRVARNALVNMSNASLRLWELACVAKHEETAGATVAPSDEPQPAHGLVATPVEPVQGEVHPQAEDEAPTIGDGEGP